MKKLIYLLPLMILAIGCNDDETTIEEIVDNKTEVVASRTCATEENLKRQIEADPSLALKMELLEMSQAKMVGNIGLNLIHKIYTIPVVVNVLYRTPEENISEEQIKSQIAVLNNDYNAKNVEFTTVPAPFSNIKANVGIKFVLEKIVRKKVEEYTYIPNDQMKTAQGILPTDPENTLNIWVCKMASFSMGYAQFPGGNPLTDGVVISTNYFGTVGTVSFPYNLGRTATHEVGHWLNLRHIWGDANCGDDYVADTPTHDTYNQGIPTYPHRSLCGDREIEMTMNYMDYVFDSAMAAFTLGQKARMLATFQNDGPRSAYIRN